MLPVWLKRFAFWVRSGEMKACVPRPSKILPTALGKRSLRFCQLFFENVPSFEKTSENICNMSVPRSAQARKAATCTSYSDFNYIDIKIMSSPPSTLTSPQPGTWTFDVQASRYRYGAVLLLQFYSQDTHTELILGPRLQDMPEYGVFWGLHNAFFRSISHLSVSLITSLPTRIILQSIRLSICFRAKRRRSLSCLVQSTLENSSTGNAMERALRPGRTATSETILLPSCSNPYARYTSSFALCMYRQPRVLTNHKSSPWKKRGKFCLSHVNTSMYMCMQLAQSWASPSADACIHANSIVLDSSMHGCNLASAEKFQHNLSFKSTHEHKRTMAMVGSTDSHKRARAHAHETITLIFFANQMMMAKEGKNVTLPEGICATHTHTHTHTYTHTHTHTHARAHTHTLTHTLTCHACTGTKASGKTTSVRAKARLSPTGTNM